MATTTVRLDPADERQLDELALIFGGRSNTIRQALRRLAADVEQQQQLAAFLDEWAAEAGPVDPQAVEAMRQRFGL